MIKRNETKKVRVGDIYIGGDSPITIQSMTTTDTRNISSTVNQIKQLEEAGCDIVRVAVVDIQAANAIRDIKKEINIPIVADIHFDYRLAIESMENGADKIRINPGNIGSEDRVKAVVEKARERQIPIRVGVNSGSLQKEILEKHSGVNAEGIVESAMLNIDLIERYDYNNIVISLKSSDVLLTVEAYEKMSKLIHYPLHLGITEAGTVSRGIIKSAIGIGILLGKGIGDTVRVSLTGDPVSEIDAANQILKTLELKKEGIELISCPTCGRCQIDLITVAEKIDKELKGIKKNLKIAVMGCAVNGPGEAREADIGIAGGKNEFLLFRKGEVVKKVSESEAVEELLNEIKKI